MVAFTYPWALLLALPAAWLLWRSRRPALETHPVANLFLWLGSAGANATSRGDRRAAPPWLVWIQAAVLVALAVAIAGPSIRSTQPTATLIVDDSPSMSARDASGSRAALAQAAAASWRAAQPPRSRIAIVNAADLAPAIETALRQTAGTVTVITDLPPPADVAALGIAWQQIGAPADNVGITGLTGQGDGGAVVEVTNFGAAAARLSVNITDGANTRTENAVVDAGGVRGFTIAPGPDRTVSAELRIDDHGGNAGNALAADDKRRVDIRRSTALHVVRAGNTEAGDALVDAAVRALPDVAISAADDRAGDRVWVCSSQCDAPANAAKLVFSTGGSIPQIVRREIGGVRSIAVSVDLPSSTWPLTPAFPIFIADSLDWLARRPAASVTAERMAVIAESNTRSAAPPTLIESAPPTPPGTPRSLWFPFAALAIAAVLAELALRRRRASIRLSAAAVLLGALAGLSLPIGGAKRSAVIALDASASVAGNFRAANERVRRETGLVAGRDQLSVVRFGGSSSDIASGIRRALAALPGDGDRRILLMTDGQQTAGDAAAAARHGRVPVDVVPIDSRMPAFIERVDAPVSSRAGAPVPIRMTLKGRPGEVLGLSVSRDGRVLDSRRVALDDEGSSSVTITDSPQAAGVAFYRAALTNEQIGVTLSEAGAAVTVTGRSRVLVISDTGIFSRLAAAGPFDLVLVQPSAAPDTREGLAAFGAVVIDGMPLRKFSSRQLDAFAAAVSLDGAGLLLLGGADSLDASEFTANAFADALPVDFSALPNPPSASTSLALLVDISGSMASTSDGVTKISAARDSIARALSIVPKNDAVNVIGFAAQPMTLLAPGDPRDALSVAEKLKTLTPTGSTALSPAVRSAVTWLKSTANSRRRLLLVTDGKTSVSDADATRAAVLGQGVEVSVVTIGHDAEREWLSALAEATGGRALFPERLGDLARQVAREAGRGATGREVNEVFVARGGAHTLAPGDPGPTLGGYVAARLRDGATAAWKSRSDDAVLAAWPRGLGRVAVFSGDLGGVWGLPLRSWAQNPAFWVRATQWLARSGDTARLDAGFSLASGEPRVVVELADSHTIKRELPSVRVSLAGPSGQVSDFALHAVSRTTFEAPAALNEAGDYRATIVVTDANGAEIRTTRGWFWTGDLESQSRGLNRPLLDEIAAISGGRVLAPLGASAPTSAAATDSVWSAPRTRGRVDAVPWLMLFALALLTFDYIRRPVSEP